MVLSPLNSCKALTKTEDMRNMIRDIEDALSACPHDRCELSLGVQESLCVLIIQLLDENFRAAHLPILNLIISVVQSGPITPHLEKVLAKAFVEPIVMQHKYAADAKATVMVNTLFRLADAGIRQKAFGVIATGSALCFLLSIYNATSVRNVPICLRIEAEQRIVGILQLDLPRDIKQKVLKPLLADCILCLLSTTSVMKMLREPVENSDSILWLTTLTLEQVIKYELDIDATLITALKVRINNFMSGNLSECQRQEFQKSDDVFAQLREVSVEQQPQESYSVQCLFPFLISTMSNNVVQSAKSSSIALSLLVYIYSFDMLLNLAILLFKHHQSAESLLLALLTPHEADLSGYYSTCNVTEKNFLPLMQSRCLVTYTCLSITFHVLPMCEVSLDFTSHSNLTPLLNALIVAQYNMLLTNDFLPLNHVVDSLEDEFGISFESPEGASNTVSELSLFKALCSLYSTKDIKSVSRQMNLSILYICGFSLQSWDCIAKKFINNEMFINSMSQSTILTVTLSCYRLLSHDYCVSATVEVASNRYPQLKILSFLRQFVEIVMRRSEAEADFSLKELIRAVSALPSLLCLLSFKADQRDPIEISFADIQALLHCSYVTQETQHGKETSCPVSPLITVSESHIAFVLLAHLICTPSACPAVISQMLSYTDFLVDLYRSFLPYMNKLAKLSDMSPCIQNLLASLIGTLYFQSIADPAKMHSPAETLHNMFYGLRDDCIDESTIEIYSSISSIIFSAMDILSKLNSNVLDCDSILFLILNHRKKQILERSASSVKEFTSICVQIQSQLIFRVSNDSKLRQNLLESSTITRVYEIFDAQFFEGSTEINEKDLSLLFSYGLLLGALTLKSINEFKISADIREQLIESLIDQSLFGCESLLSLLPASFKKLQSLLSLLASAETFVATLSQLCLALTNEYKLLPTSPRDSSSTSITTTEDELLFRLALLSQIVIYIPLLCQDKTPSQAVIKLHQSCAGILASTLEIHRAFETTSAFAEKFLHMQLLTLHRLFDFLDSKLVDAIEYLRVYEGLLVFFETQTGECAEELWCIGLLRVVRLCSTPIPTMRIRIVELLCKIVEKYVSTFSPANALVLVRDVLFKSMSILITCSPTTSRSTKLSSATTVVSCHRLFFETCVSVVSSIPCGLRIQVIRAFISLVHSLSIATDQSIFDDSIRLFCIGMKLDDSQVVQRTDSLFKTSNLSLNELFSRVMQYPLMDSFFPEVFQKSLEHSPWLSLLSLPSLEDEEDTLSFTALFEDILSLLTVDGKACCQSKGLSSEVLLELCSVIFSLIPRLTDDIEIATRIIIHTITLINTIVSVDKSIAPPQIEKALNDIPVRLTKELIGKFDTQNRNSYTRIEACLDALLSYVLSRETVFVSVFTCLYEVLEQSTGQEELCKLLSARISKAFICSCSLGTFGPRTSSLCLSIVLTLYIGFSLTGAGELAGSLNISAVSSAILQLEACPQLNLMFVLAIYNNYPIFKGVISDDALYLILSRFLPHSNRYSADSLSSDAVYKTSVASSFELLAYGKLDSEAVLMMAKNEGDAAPDFEALSVLYSYDKSKQELLVTIDSASLRQILFNVTLFTLSFYMESALTLKKYISLTKNVLTHVEYNHLHFHVIPPSARLYKHVSTLLKYIIKHKFPAEIALSILPHESMPLLYYTSHRDSTTTTTTTLVRPQLFALQASFFHFFKVCRELPLAQQIELIYLEALTAEMKVT